MGEISKCNSVSHNLKRLRMLGLASQLTFEGLSDVRRIKSINSFLRTEISSSSNCDLVRDHRDYYKLNISTEKSTNGSKTVADLKEYEHSTID